MVASSPKFPKNFGLFQNKKNFKKMDDMMSAERHVEAVDGAAATGLEQKKEKRRKKQKVKPPKEEWIEGVSQAAKKARVAIGPNEKFRKYYGSQLGLSEEEFSTMISAFTQPLPVVFRLTLTGLSAENREIATQVATAFSLPALILSFHNRILTKRLLLLVAVA